MLCGLVQKFKISGKKDIFAQFWILILYIFNMFTMSSIVYIS